MVTYNKGAKHVGAILTDNPDSYYISKCSDEMWIIIELSSEAFVDTVSVNSGLRRLNSGLRRVD